MTKESFTSWLEKLKMAWEGKNPEGAPNLCAENFIWYETPFTDPIKTKENLLEEWKTISDHENIQFSYKILSVNQNIGFAHWSAAFTRISTKENVEMDGVFMVKLDDKGLCMEFHQWYNIRDESTTKG